MANFLKMTFEGEKGSIETRCCILPSNHQHFLCNRTWQKNGHFLPVRSQFSRDGMCWKQNFKREIHFPESIHLTLFKLVLKQKRTHWEKVHSYICYRFLPLEMLEVKNLCMKNSWQGQIRVKQVTFTSGSKIHRDTEKLLISKIIY